MSAQLARIVIFAFIAFLFVCDRKRRTGCSNALWIPLMWILILGSRPFSSWFGGGVNMETTDDYVEGSPVDRLVTSAGMPPVRKFHATGTPRARPIRPPATSA